MLADDFNCRSRWSDAKVGQWAELEFLRGRPYARARVNGPSLRNVAGRASYTHAGQFTNLEQRLAHEDRAPPRRPDTARNRCAQPREVQQLASFLRPLSGGTAAPAELLRDPR